MISIKNVTLQYPGKSPVIALKNISLDINANESLAIIGPSGSGKSTLLFLLAGLLTPTQGTIMVNDQKVTGPRQDISVILQDFGLFPWKTVWENAILGLQVRRAPEKMHNEVVSPLLKTLGLEKFKNHYPGQLSGGMRQRLAIARALATNPSFLLMDEPFSSLDALTRESLQNLLLEIWQREKLTIVLVTHSIEEAAFLAERVIVLSPRPGQLKKIITNSTPKSTFARTSDLFFATNKAIREGLEENNAAL